MAIEYTPESSLVADPAEGGSFSASNNAELAGAQSFAAQAKLSETAAATSETNSATSETNSATSETNAATSETNAATSATNADAAKVSAESARDSAAADSVSAESAKVSAESARDSAESARDSAESARDTAAGSATSAATAQTAAEAARDAALASFDSFDDRYLGPKASDPTVDNDGDALAAGMLYFNTTTDDMKVYEGSVWVNAYGNLTDALAKANNLSDLPNAATARTNLGLGTAATTAATDYATAAQGTKVDGIEAGADVTDTTNVVAALSAGTGISLSNGGVVGNTSPDQTVALTGAGATSISGTYPNFTITSTDTNTDTDTTYTAGSGLSLTGTEFANTAPDQTVSLTGAGATSISGTYPNFTITSTDNNTDTTYTAGTGLTLTGTEFSIGQDVATTDSPTFAAITATTGNYSTGVDQNTFTTAHGNIQLGPMNSSYAHIYTGSPSFYFNKQLKVLGDNVITSSLTQSSNIAIRSASPTIFLRDTDHNSSMIHCNSNKFYVLRGGNDSTTWSQVNGKWPMELNLTNNNAVFGANITAYSDASLKENVTPIGNSMEMFNQIDSKRFDWIEDGKHDIGFIAQDVQAAGLTEVVIENDQHDLETGELLDTKLTLDYGRMVSVLWDVVKELKAEIDELKGGV